MSFLRSMWKNNSKHKKLCEELALANSIKDFSQNAEDIDEVSSDEVVSYVVKYIGHADVESSRPSEETSTAAVKKIIASQKSNGGKKRVLLSISPNGIEVVDTETSETILQVSIYRISHCSSDASHSHVFSFIESVVVKGQPDLAQGFTEKDPEGPLKCHAFLCQKRKMAQTVCLTVARSFERAYQIWQNQQFVTEQKRQKITAKNDCNNKKTAEDAQSERSLLIDLNTDLANCSRDTRDYFQNTWVSFDDDTADEFHQIAAQKLSIVNHQWKSNIACS